MDTNLPGQLSHSLTVELALEYDRRAVDGTRSHSAAFDSARLFPNVTNLNDDRDCYAQQSLDWRPDDSFKDTLGGTIIGKVGWKSADSKDMEDAVPTTCDMTPDELQALKAFLDQGTIRSNWDAGTWLSHWLLGAEIKMVPAFKKTDQIERIAQQLELGFKRIWQCLAIRESFLSEEVELMERSKLSLGRAIDLLPAKKGIENKTPEEQATLNLEFKSIIETNPGAARSGEAYQRWNHNFQVFFDKCAASPKKAQQKRFRKRRNAAKSGLKKVHAELEKMCRELPNKLRGECEAFLGKIVEVSSGLEEFYAEAEKHFAADADSGKSQPTKKRTRTPPLDDWTSGS